MTAIERRERLEELAALVAAGGAEEAEQAELRQLAGGDAEAEELVRSYADAASLLALGLDQDAGAPPAGALAAVQARIAREPGAAAEPAGGAAGSEGSAGGAGPAGTGGKVVPMRARRRRSWATGAAVALPLAAAATFALLWWNARGAREELSRSLARAESRLAGTRARLQTLETPELRLATMKSQQGGTLKVLVAPGSRRVLVLAFDLPPQPGRDYQLWFLPGEGKPIPAGLLRPGPDGLITTEAVVPPGVKGAAVTLEPRGGSPQPTTAPLMHGDLL